MLRSPEGVRRSPDLQGCDRIVTGPQSHQADNAVRCLRTTAGAARCCSFDRPRSPKDRLDHLGEHLALALGDGPQAFLDAGIESGSVMSASAMAKPVHAEVSFWSSTAPWR